LNKGEAAIWWSSVLSQYVSTSIGDTGSITIVATSLKIRKINKISVSIGWYIYTVTCRRKAGILEPAYTIIPETTEWLSTFPPQRTTTLGYVAWQRLNCNRDTTCSRCGPRRDYIRKKTFSPGVRKRIQSRPEGWCVVG
jgi:hypothetical protein